MDDTLTALDAIATLHQATADGWTITITYINETYNVIAYNKEQIHQGFGYTLPIAINDIPNIVL